MLINLADEFGFKIKTFQHVRRLQGRKEIAAHGAGASIFADSWGYKIEAYDAIPYNAAIMTRARRCVDELRLRRKSSPFEHRGCESNALGRLE